MDVHGIRDIRTLERIVALLAALAGLAVMAAGRSFPVRFMVLAILRPAVVIARDHVAGADERAIVLRDLARDKHQLAAFRDHDMAEGLGRRESFRVDACD